MIFIRNLAITYYRSLRSLELRDLKDLNILVGPNNCGKTSILELIGRLDNLDVGGAYTYPCAECEKYSKNNNYPAMSFPFGNKDFYLKGDEAKSPRLSILFNEDAIEPIIGKLLLDRKRSRLRQTPPTCTKITDSIDLVYSNYRLMSEHLSPFIDEGIIDVLEKSIVYCPERRLDRYRDANLPDYLKGKQFTTSQRSLWVDFISRIVDAKIKDEKDMSVMIRMIEGERVDGSLEEQGSGVRSLACLAADILPSGSRIILIDEPELGLNPFVKQEFLKFLLEQSKDKQIFLATHDPTFVNPVIWRDRGVRVFLYSLVDDKFIALNLLESQEDPESFAGYMPHTTALKDVHIYVEGSSDVYIFQVFLLKHLRLNYENWPQILNKMGIYHMGGSCWSHLLYTVPKKPYRCMIVLDGDKRKEVLEVCSKYDRSDINSSKFKFCETTGEIKGTLSSDSHPVYCLKERCIEEYLEPKPNQEDPTYNKKVRGPNIADMMNAVPGEIEEIFEMLLGGMGSRVRVAMG